MKLGYSGALYLVPSTFRRLACAYSGVAPTLTFFTHREGERRSRLRHVFGTRTRSGLVQSTRCRPASGSHSRYDASRGIEPLPLSSWPYAVCKVRVQALPLET